ncbi:DUF4328 domain-containing protein [Actinophytocola sp. NPDC049390]|uniref:DUF4328 domain-containing protein n=1 Tax=Actinophytocola sp. NPDC049390 TaxID=3363894 RepID=UPI00379E2435
MTSQDARPLALLPVRPIATVATIMLFATCAANVFGTWTDWRRHEVATDFVAEEPGVGIADLVAADNMAMGAVWLMVLALLATAAVFLTWLWRTRLNAERLCRAEHRLPRGWTVGAWFVPVVNLWFPMRIVTDVWRTSRPGVPADTYRVDGLAQSPLVHAWWYTLLANVAVLVVLRVETRSVVTVDVLRAAALYGTVSTVLLVVAAVLLSQVIRQITRWQSTPR